MVLFIVFAAALLPALFINALIRWYFHATRHGNKWTEILVFIANGTLGSVFVGWLFWSFSDQSIGIGYAILFWFVANLFCAFLFALYVLVRRPSSRKERLAADAVEAG